jgi:chromosomal replication initiator protein
MNYAILPGLPRVKNEITEDQVIHATCQYFKISIGSLRRRIRVRRIVEPRQILMYLLRIEAGLTFMKIGELLNIDHSTVVHTMKIINNRLSINDEITTTAINKIRSALCVSRVNL